VLFFVIGSGSSLFSVSIKSSYFLKVCIKVLFSFNLLHFIVSGLSMKPLKSLTKVLKSVRNVSFDLF
jgi:hypothetical protein